MDPCKSLILFVSTVVNTSAWVRYGSVMRGTVARNQYPQGGDDATYQDLIAYGSSTETTSLLLEQLCQTLLD